MRIRGWLIVILVLLTSDKATASNELNGLFDARSMGMGGTGAAFLDSAGVMAINPAALDQIGKLSLTLNGLLFVTQLQAPYRVTHTDDSGGTYDNYETVRSKTLYAPLFFLGGAYRVHDRVVIGAGFYPLIGQGTQAVYRPAPEQQPDLWIKNEAAIFMLEVGVPVSVRLAKTLSLAVMWRATYLSQTVTTPVPGNGIGGTLVDASMNPISAHINASGTNLSGVQVGLHWRPAPSLRLGLTYRSKVTVDGEGTTKTKNPLDGSSVSLRTIQPFSAPHTIRGGIALSVLDEKLLFATDVKYLMYSEAFKTIDTTTISNGVRSTTRTPAKWKDSYNVHLGAEYRVIDRLAVRAGYIIATSATPEAYAQAAMAPPGVSHAGTAGLGVALLDQLSLDVAGTYVVLQSKIYAATPNNAGVGTYASRAGEFSLSATFRM